MRHGRSRLSKAAGPILLAAYALGGASCTDKSAPVTTRLVDVFRPEQVSGRAAAPASTPARMEWTFRDAAAGPPHAAAGAPHSAPRAWEPGPGVDKLEVRDGRLQGRTRSIVISVRDNQSASASSGMRLVY